MSKYEQEEIDILIWRELFSKKSVYPEEQACIKLIY